MLTTYGKVQRVNIGALHVAAIRLGEGYRAFIGCWNREPFSYMLIKISEIKLNPSNPRTISKSKMDKLVQSIKSFPEMLKLRPIVVNDDMVILGGNMRLQACKKAGLKEVPIIKASELTPEQQREFIIKDNVGFGEWDWDLIKADWDREQLDEWGMELDNWQEQPGEEDDYEIPDKIETNIKLGDLIEIGEHRLLCGDSTNSDTVAKLMNGSKADMVFTDPPYNIDYDGGSKKRNKIENDKLNDFYDFLYDSFMNLYLNIKAGASVYITHADSERINFTKAFIESGFHLSSIIIWVKNNSTFGRQDYFWKHEPILYGWNNRGSHKWMGDNKQDTVWNIDRPSRSDEHPTMKPIELISKSLNNSSKTDDLILDIFLGSGSTMVAAHQLNRKCYGMELDPNYCQVIVDRMIKLDENLQIKINGVDYEIEHN